MKTCTFWKSADSDIMESSEDCTSDNSQIENESFFKVGDEFNNCNELELKIKQWESNTMNTMSIADCKTIESAQKRCDRTLNPDLKYYQLKYCCIHGGKKVTILQLFFLANIHVYIICFDDSKS